jgi:hypothetical protein
MKTKSRPMRGFRATPENEQRLEYAEKLGLNLSELINEVLSERLHDVLKKKTEMLREALKLPTP